MDITKYFKEKVVEVINKESIENENSRRPYIIGLMNDRREESKVIEVFSMSNYRGAIMPIVARGKTPSHDSFAPVKLDKLSLMHFFVEAAHTEYTIAWATKKINSMKGQGASESDMEDLIAEIYSKLYLDRIIRLQDLLAYQVGQCLSNFTLDSNPGFISSGLIKNSDIYQYKVEGLDAVIDGLEMNPLNSNMPSYNPIKYLLDRLVNTSRSEPNQIWMGDYWASWFLNNPAWKEMHPTKLMLEHKMKYTPAGTSSEVDALGANLLYDYNGIKFVHITKKATLFDNEGNKITRPVFNPNSIISLNTETLGSTVYSPVYQKPRTGVTIISNNEKMNFYEVPQEGFPEKDGLYRSEGWCLGAILGTDSIQRMTMAGV